MYSQINYVVSENIYSIGFGRKLFCFVINFISITYIRKAEKFGNSAFCSFTSPLFLSNKSLFTNPLLQFSFSTCPSSLPLFLSNKSDSTKTLFYNFHFLLALSLFPHSSLAFLLCCSVEEFAIALSSSI